MNIMKPATKVELHLLITGYYFKNNLGDDLLLKVANSIFTSKVAGTDIVIRTISTDEIKTYNEVYMDELITWTDRVILFGGEVLNTYFLDRLIAIKQAAFERHRKNIPFYAIGVSTNTAYDEIVSHVDLFDYIIFRNSVDYKQYLPRLTSEYCSVLPDPVFLLKPKKNESTGLCNFSCIRARRKPKGEFAFHIGFFLSQTSSKDAELFEQVVRLVRQCIFYYGRVYLFTMCSGMNENENDAIMNQRVFDQLNAQERKYVLLLKDTKSIEDYIGTLDCAVCWRFHSHIFAIQRHIPFLSISTTPKVQTLLSDTNLQHLSYVKRDLRDGLEYLLERYTMIKVELTSVCDRLETEVQGYAKWPIYTRKISQLPRIPLIASIPKILDAICNKFKEHTTEGDHGFNASLLIYLITGRLQTPYHWGLTEKFAQGNNIDGLRGDIEWLIKEQIKEGNYAFYYKMTHYLGLKNELLNPVGGRMLNIHYMDQNDMKGVHRAGWQYVIGNMEDRLATFHPMAIRCDLYLDRTFHWNYDLNCRIGILPYVKPWMGFIHHTSDTEYTRFNVVEMFKKPAFIESLKKCRALIVLSIYLRNQVAKQLKECGFSGIPIVVLHHPTEFIPDNRCFNLCEFEKLSKRRIVQVGAWYRNIGAIFDLHMGLNMLNYERFALKGPQMDGYYKKKTEQSTSWQVMKISRDGRNCEENAHFSIRAQVSRDDAERIRLDGGTLPMDVVLYKQRHVEILDQLSADDYDELFRLCIIFINLIDGSAVNTIIEAIVRNTPILVNPLDAVVEYLGKDYPFYYSSYDEAAKKANNMELVRKTHQYLKSMDKTFLRIEHFIESFKNAPIFYINRLGKAVNWSK